MLCQIKGYKKLSYDKLKNEEFKRKSYFSNLSLPQSWMCFRVASSHVQTIRTNFSRKYKYKSLACPGSGSGEDQASLPSGGSSDQETQPSDTQTHVLICDSYSDIRLSLDFDPRKDELLADYFIKVVKRRVENGED